MSHSGQVSARRIRSQGTTTPSGSSTGTASTVSKPSVRYNGPKPRPARFTGAMLVQLPSEPTPGELRVHKKRPDTRRNGGGVDWRVRITV
jgi:hypothetical protein